MSHPLISARPFGTVPGLGPATLYTIRHHAGAEITLSDYGATWVGWRTADRTGAVADVIQGFDDAEGYARHTGYFGATCGRVSNRIAGGKFKLEGRDYALAVNNGPNHLHGGKVGFDRHLWTATIGGTPEAPAITFSRVSPAGEEGYPGTLTMAVTYTFTADNAVRLDYHARTDTTTIVNLTNHAYFNLAGHDHPTVLDHELTLPCEHYLRANADYIPTGEIVRVEGTPLDFRTPHTLGERITDNFDQLTYGRGYDQSFVVPGPVDTMRPCATLRHPGSGRVMRVTTTEPDIHLYTGNWIVECVADVPGKGGAQYGFRSAVCLETQRFPDAINQPAFRSIVLHPGEHYRTASVYTLTCE